MSKFISYPLLVLTVILLMGHTKSTLVSTAIPVLAKLSHPLAINSSPVNKTTGSLKNAATGHYRSWRLNNTGLSETAFNYAMKGYNYLSGVHLVNKKNIVSIVDFSKPSTQKRLYVIDVNTGKILFKTWVAHGQNSGDEYAKNFSNLPESH